MHLQTKGFLTILSILVLSCTHQNKENNATQQQTRTKEKLETSMAIPETERMKIMDHLQGKWKEAAYPYRTAEFLHSTVQFIEEGTENKPVFEKFEISENCPFDNNNIKDIKTGEIMLSLPETKRCEKLKIAGDTLILHGFSANTGEDYNILYLRLK